MKITQIQKNAAARESAIRPRKQSSESSMGSLDTGLDFYRAVLDLRGVRQGLLSADIANASTPGFKAVDLDFREALATTLMSDQMVANAPAVAMLVSDDGETVTRDDDVSAVGRRSVKYQVGNSVTLDGNSVDLNYEKLAAAENALDYEAATNFTTQIVNLLMTAIKGSTAGSTRSG
jgi:flagellar basal-body rod protein FlgB